MAPLSLSKAEEAVQGQCFAFLQETQQNVIKGLRAIPEEEFQTFFQLL
jgi:hypothetical protein